MLGKHAKETRLSTSVKMAKSIHHDWTVEAARQGRDMGAVLDDAMLDYLKKQERKRRRSGEK
jgi:hypothetical protein